MTFAAPSTLLLVVPLALAGLFVWLRGDLLVSALPGQWNRIVAPGLRRFLAQRMPERRRGQLGLCLTIAALLVVALARPGIEAGGAPTYGNLSGRVLVLDLGADGDVRDQRLFARRLFEQSLGIPTAIVAVAGDAYDVVPLTTDRRQAFRYLSALEPSVMPEAGRALHRGLAHGEAVLKKAGIVAGQVVLVTNGRPPPQGDQAPPSGLLRAVAVMGPRTLAWADYAEGQDARLVGPTELASVVRDLDDAVSYQRRTRAATTQIDLTPWLIGLALCLWLGLFRRRVPA